MILQQKFKDPGRDQRQKRNVGQNGHLYYVNAVFFVKFKTFLRNILNIYIYYTLHFMYTDA